MSSATVPAMSGVDIQWNLGNQADTVAACKAMMKGYGIVYPAALVSRHTERLAIDITISKCQLSGKPLWDLGKSFGVIKLESDPPHWSSDGH